MRMKALKVISVLVILGIGFVFVPGAGASELGFKMGVQHYKGVKAGLFYAVRLTDSLLLQPEVYYSQREYRYCPTQWYDLPEENAYDTVRFIEVPVLLKYKFEIGAGIEPFVFAGGYAGIRVSRDFYVDSVNFILSRYAGVDGGFVVGAGYEQRAGKAGSPKFHIDIRYYIGLVDVQEVVPYLIEISVPPGYTRNRSLSLTAGIRF